MNRRSGEPGTLANLRIFLDHVERMDMGPLHSFTCEEVTALADVMSADRGETKATWVIVHHLADAFEYGEEDEELADHLNEWPMLWDMLHEHVFEDAPVMKMLDTLSKVTTNGVVTYHTTEEKEED